MSGYTDDECWPAACCRSKRTFIQKPFAPDTLVAQVRAGLVGVMPGAL